MPATHHPFLHTHTSPASLRAIQRIPVECRLLMMPYMPTGLTLPSVALPSQPCDRQGRSVTLLLVGRHTPTDGEKARAYLAYSLDIAIKLNDPVRNPTGKVGLVMPALLQMNDMHEKCDLTVDSSWASACNAAPCRGAVCDQCHEMHAFCSVDTTLLTSIRRLLPTHTHTFLLCTCAAGRHFCDGRWVGWQQGQRSSDVWLADVGDLAAQHVAAYGHFHNKN